MLLGAELNSFQPFMSREHPREHTGQHSKALQPNILYKSRVFQQLVANALQFVYHRIGSAA